MLLLFPLKKHQVLVNIEDVNDNVPLFDVADYNISIVEHIPNGFEIMQFHATDKVCMRCFF